MWAISLLRSPITRDARKRCAGTAARLRRVACGAEAKRLAERMSLDLNRKVTDLSFGNKKKVAIVCALQHKPDLLILTSPPAGWTR